MSSPSWLLHGLATVMVVVSVYSLLRIVMATRTHRVLHRDVNLSHALDGAAMAGMLVPSLQFLPDAAWETVFAVLFAWFGWRSICLVLAKGEGGTTSDHAHRLSHSVSHLTMAAAMLYMYLAATPAAASSGSGMVMAPPSGAVSDVIFLPMLLIVALAASAVWHVDSAPRFSPAGTRLADATASNGSGPSRRQPALGADVLEARPSLAPRLETACHVALCIAMSFMLVLML